MFKHTKTFNGFSVDHLQKAKAFYSQTLGLEVRDLPMGHLELRIEGSNPVNVYPKANHVPATFTILNFPVVNIDEAVDKLIAKGVTFEQYGGDIRTDEKGICRSEGNGPDIAWFKDPAGNILSVLQDR
jgi:catechol 2,3-dioxygenase-like lactoylglutathione lyase family enzyme